MELLTFIVLLVSVAGNIATIIYLVKLLNEKVSGPKQSLPKDLAPFVTPMKDSDQFDLSEVPDEALKDSVKKIITSKEPLPIPDDEEEAAKEQENLT
jgi:hypothetical protein